MFHTAAPSVAATAGTAHRVDSNVYIGGYQIAADPNFIRREGISRIVKLFGDTREYPGGYHRHRGVKYLIIPADDDPDYDIRDGAVAAVRFIQEGIADNERILVHCHAGISRSATVVLLHLMINRGYDLDTAIARLKLVRSFISPNPGFMEHLRATDARMKLLRAGSEKRYVAPPPVLAYAARGAFVNALAAPQPPASVWAFSDARADSTPL